MKNENLQIEKLIGYILRIGAIIAIVLMIAGLVFDSKIWMQYGIFILIITPTIRVIASVFLFTKNKDYKFVLITIIVLLILFIAFLIGKA